jgi:hypothetical protein
MWMAGVQFGGRRDLYELFGYKRIIDYRDFLAIYYRQGLAKRIIDMPVLSTWADPPQLITQDPAWNEAWNTIVEEMALWHHIMRLDKLAGLGRFAVMVVGFDDGQKLDTPIQQADGKTIKRKVIYLQPYHERSVSVLQFEADTASARYGLPTMYHVNPGRYLTDGNQTSFSQGMNAVEIRQPFNVHWTRVVHVAENLLEDRIFGSSRLEVIFNDLCDVLKVSGGAAETFWMIANRGMQVNVDKDMDLSPDDAKDLQQEVENYQHQIQRFIRTRGVEVKSLGTDTANPDGAFKIIISLLSGATGIPQSDLTGIGATKIASQQDRANWSDRIAERVTEYAEPIILKRFLDCMIYAGVVTAPKGSADLKISWPEAFKLNPMERSQTSALMARSAANLMKGHMLAHNSTKGITGQDAAIGKDGQKVTGPQGSKTQDPKVKTKVKANGQPNTPEDDEQMNQTDEQGVEPLFNRDEMRQMVSFGRRPPVFDMPTPSGDVPSPGDDSANSTTTPPTNSSN